MTEGVFKIINFLQKH